MKKLRVALYARVASADQLGTALDLQERMLETYAKGHGYEVVAKVRETGSGLCCNRPGLNRILEMPCQEVQGILIKSLDRVGRDPIETMGWKRQFEASGKKLLCLEENEMCPASADLYERLVEYFKTE